MNASVRAKKRARVRHFAGHGLSSPAIAAKVGVSESTVRRWRAEDAHTPAADSVRTPDATPVSVAQTDAIPGSVTAGDVSRAYATDALTVPLDAGLRGHLAVITETGLTEQGAVELALRFLAFALDDAWVHGVTPRGVIPLMSVRSRPADTTTPEATP